LPGTGTVVAQRPDSSRAERSKLLDNEVERLAVEAIKLGLSIDEVSAALERHWERLKPSASLAGKGGGRK